MWYRRVDAAKKHTSVIAALWLSSKEATKLVLDPKGVPADSQNEPAENMHITLVYLGQADDLKPKRKLIEAAMQAFAEKHSKLKGRVSGFGCFSSNTDQKPLYASYDSGELPEFREDLVSSLQAIGIEPETTHGFTPHITLAYLPIATDPRAIEVPDMHLDFDQVTLCWADDQTHFKLS